MVACSPAGPTASASPGTSGAISPKATPWPGDTVLAALAIASADTQFEKVGTDMNAALDAQDYQGLETVTGDVLTFLESVQVKIPAVQAYPGTKALGDQLAAAYGQMIAGVKQIHAALIAGNGTGVTDGFKTFGAGSTAYVALRPALADLATEAIAQQRLIVR